MRGGGLRGLYSDGLRGRCGSDGLRGRCGSDGSRFDIVRCFSGRHHVHNYGATGGLFSTLRTHETVVIGNAPVRVVFMPVLLGKAGELGHDEAGQEATEDGHREGSDQSIELVRHLIRADTTEGKVVPPAVVTVLRGSCEEDAGETSDDSGDAVEVVHTARVKHTELLGELVRQLLIPDHTHHTGKHSNEESASGLSEEVGSSADGDAASKS